jgi:hypothetical protein
MYISFATRMQSNRINTSICSLWPQRISRTSRYTSNRLLTSCFKRKCEIKKIAGTWSNNQLSFTGSPCFRAKHEAAWMKRENNYLAAWGSWWIRRSVSPLYILGSTRMRSLALQDGTQVGEKAALSPPALAFHGLRFCDGLSRGTVQRATRSCCAFCGSSGSQILRLTSPWDITCFSRTSQWAREISRTCTCVPLIDLLETLDPL